MCEKRNKRKYVRCEMMIKAVIFDLDGVIVSTDECHYKAWKKLADEVANYYVQHLV